MYETVFKHVLFPTYEGFIKRRKTHVYLSEYERTQWLPAHELERLQLGKLNALLDHCWRHVPFLKRFWQDHGVSPRQLSSVSELADFPVLTKQDMKANYDEMIATPFKGRSLSKTTGGSTGDPFRFEYTTESYERRAAVAWRGSRWAGVDLGTRTAYVWGAGVGQAQSRRAAWKDRFFHRMYNRLLLNAFAIREDNVDEYIAAIEQYGSKVVVGYVTPVVIIARRMNQLGKRLTTVRAVLTGAEALYTPERSEIEQAFGCPVFNTYGSREVMLMAAECSLHKGMHISADHLIVETVDSGGHPLLGGSGDVVVTDLHNYAMPFVRYVNGDRATLSTELCGCGRGLPLLKNVDGRILDLIVTPDGRNVPGEFFVYVMLDFPSVRQYQVVQTQMDEIEVRLVPGSPLSVHDHTRLEQKARQIVGAEMRITIREVAAIPPAPSGKRRVTVSLVHAAAQQIVQ